MGAASRAAVAGQTVTSAAAATGGATGGALAVLLGGEAAGAAGRGEGGAANPPYRWSCSRVWEALQAAVVGEEVPGVARTTTGAVGGASALPPTGGAVAAARCGEKRAAGPAWHL